MSYHYPCTTENHVTLKLKIKGAHSFEFQIECKQPTACLPPVIRFIIKCADIHFILIQHMLS